MFPLEAQVKDAAAAAVQQLIGRPPRKGDRLISAGIIDSLSVLKLIALLEDRLSISIPPDNLQPEDFDTLDLIAETVRRVGMKT
jgi:acyl carrier protein